MAGVEIPDGWVAQGYRFALDPTPRQVEELLSHAGGARFAYNVMLAAVKANLDQRAAERSYGIAEDDLTPCMSWSFVSLRNDWNQRKHTVAVRADGTPRFRCRRDRRPPSPGHGRARSGVSAQCDKASKLCSGCGDLKAAVNTARYAQRETDPSTGVVTGGADREPPPTGGAVGRETRTRAEVGDNADDGGSASPKGEAA